MHAAVVEQFGKPLVLRELDIPSPGAGQILVKTEACGVCHTDLHAAHGDWPVKPTLPFIPGHEAIGLVVAVGSGVTIVKEGDRVGVPWLYSACGHCEYCLTGWETVCAQAQFGGYTRNGGFAEYLLADPNYVAHVPAGLAAADAAPLICAGITTYKGIKETEARPGEWIAISGVGGLGHLAIQYAKAMGLLVCAIDIDDGKLAHAKRVGADLVINAKSGDPAAAVKKADRRRSAWRFDYGALAHRIQTGRRHDPEAWHLRPGRTAAGRISRSRSSMWWRTASPSAVRSSARARIWPKRSPSPPGARSRPISSCSLCLRSTKSSTGLQHGDVASRVVLEFTRPPDDSWDANATVELPAGFTHKRCGGLYPILRRWNTGTFRPLVWTRRSQALEPLFR